MSFVLHRTWDAIDPSRAGTGGASPVPALSGLLSDGRDRYAWKTGATMLSILVHILILWLFLTRLAGNPGDGSGPGSAILHSFSLSDSSASAATPAREVLEVPPLPPAAVQPSEIDSSAETELEPEWSVSRLPPRPAPPSTRSSPDPAASASTAGSAPGTGTAGSGSGGGEVYDPYAGAAPLRRERGGASSGTPSLGDRMLSFFGFGSPSAGGLTLDEEALDAVRRSVAERLPGRRGTAELIVRVSPTGVVLEVSALSGTAPPEARDALGRALIGKRLFLGNAVDAQTLSLPTLRLG